VDLVGLGSAGPPAFRLLLVALIEVRPVVVQFRAADRSNIDGEERPDLR
jgi:hypothetical protein